MTGPRSEPPMPMLTTLRMRLPVYPCHSPVRTRRAKSDILSNTACTSGTTSLTIDEDALVPRRAQRHVQHGAVLGDVDLIAAEHGVDALAQAALRGEVQQQTQRLVGDAVLGVVQVQASRFQP